MMTIPQQIITILLCIAGTMLTRFLPFIVFSEHRQTPAFVRYLGKVLPSAVFGMLVIYCLKDVNILQGSHGLPELIGIAVTAGVHLWKRQMLCKLHFPTALSQEPPEASFLLFYTHFLYNTINIRQDLKLFLFTGIDLKIQYQLKSKNPFLAIKIRPYCHLTHL